MRNRQLIPLALFASLILTGHAYAQETVRAWQEELSIPTYTVYPDNPYPFFDPGPHSHRIYPYARQDNLSRERLDREYTVLRIENEYLCVTAIPFMGKLYDIYDKVHSREVLYTNHVIKPALIGIRGAWCSGGMEYNFPFAHTATSFSTVDHALQENPDGSASIVLSNIERRYGMKWIVRLTLRPGKYYVEQSVKLYNRSDAPHRYYWWAIAAVHVNDDSQIIYPAQRVIEHWQTLIYSWPIADGSVESSLKGKDISYHRNAPPHGVCWSAYLCKEDFFGYYDHRIDKGIFHYADRNALQGTKFWDWGRQPQGYWRGHTVLTDDDGEYNEIDSGLYLTQTDLRFLPPHGVITWTEYWFPVNGLKGFIGGNPNGALNVLKSDRTAQILVNVNQRVEDAGLRVVVAGKQVLAHSLTLRPGEVFSEAIPCPDGSQMVSVTLTSKEGEELLTYVEKPPVPEDQLPKPGVYPKRVTPIDEMTPEEAYLEGMNRLRSEEVDKAIAYFQAALRNDPGHSPTHTALGIIKYKRAMWAAATAEFRAALQRNPDQGAPHYYLGLVHKRRGELPEAIEHLSLAAKHLDTEAAAHHFLGEIALAQAQPAKAITHFQNALARNRRAAKTQNLLALAYRKAGYREKAWDLNSQIVTADPTNYLAVWEKYVLGKDKRVLERFRELIRLEDQSYLGLACDYAACGLYDEACKLLRDLAQLKQNDTFPIVYYYLGYFSKQTGANDYVESYHRVAGLKSWDYMFPNRLEAFAVLEDVVQACPDDYVAHCALGNLFCNTYQIDTAIQHWQNAADIVGQLPEQEVAKRSQFVTVIFRNLGYVHNYVNDDSETGFGWYVKGLRHGPLQAHYYRELGEAASAAGKIDSGIRHLEAALQKVRKPSFVVRGLVPLYIATGNDERIIELVEGNRFDAWEGEYTVYNWYKDAHTRKAGRLAQEGRLQESAKELERALSFPENLGIIPGVSSDGSMKGETRIHWRLAGVYRELGKDDLAEEHLRRGAFNPPPGRAFEGLYYCALCLRALGNEQEAAETFDKIIEDGQTSLVANPNLTTAAVATNYYYIGIAHAGKAERDLASKNLQMSVRSFEEGGATTNPLYKEAKAALNELKGS